MSRRRSSPGMAFVLVVSAMLDTRLHAAAQSIGKLCVGGDWACAHGDYAALRDIALRLSALAPEPMHCTLLELADACFVDSDRASQLWSTCKDALFRD